MHKQLMLSAALTIAILQPLGLIAQPGPVDTRHDNINKTVQQEAWLGLALKAIPPILRSQLGPIIPERQGIIITSVIDESPAAKSGLQVHDIILSVDDQKIYSATQLTELIKATPPESRLHLTIVRQSKTIEITATLGAHDRLIRPQWQSQWPQLGQRWSMPPVPNFQAPGPGYQGNNQSSLSWDSFESVQVTTLSDGRYHAEVKYKDPQGNQKEFTFEGKREEIIRQVNQQKDLPQAKKQALLTALNMNPDAIFNQPFFQGGNPFADPFFQQGLPGLNNPNLQRFFQNHRVRPRAHPQAYPGTRHRAYPQGDIL